MLRWIGVLLQLSDALRLTQGAFLTGLDGLRIAGRNLDKARNRAQASEVPLHRLMHQRCMQSRSAEGDVVECKAESCHDPGI